MKKNYLWTLAALFAGGFALTACDVSDNPNPNPLGFQEKEVLNLDFETGEAADYFALGKEEDQLVEPTADGSTGRAATIISNKDRGDYVKTDADLTNAVFYTAEMDILLTKSPKATQFAVVSQSAWAGEEWAGWLHNWGIFWRTNKAQEHTGILFSFDFDNSNTANMLVDIDADGNGVTSGQWEFEDNVWYHLTLDVNTVSRTADYKIAQKANPNEVLVSGTYDVPEGDSMLMKGVYWRNGRVTTGTGAVAIDNVKIVGVFN